MKHVAVKGMKPVSQEASKKNDIYTDEKLFVYKRADKANLFEVELLQ